MRRLIAKYTYPGAYTVEAMKKEFVAGTGNPKNYLTAIIIGQTPYNDPHNWIYAEYGVANSKVNKKDFRGLHLFQCYESEMMQVTVGKTAIEKVGMDVGDCVAGILRVDHLYSTARVKLKDGVPYLIKNDENGSDENGTPVSKFPGSFYDANRFNKPDKVFTKDEYQLINLGTKKISSWAQLRRFCTYTCPPTWGQVEEKGLTWGDLEKYNSWKEFLMTGDWDEKYA